MANNEGAALLDLIKERKFTLLSYDWDDLDQAVKGELVKWLDSENMPTDKPTDVVGTDYVLAWYNDNYKLYIFDLSYDGPEQCAGPIVFYFDGTTCTYLYDDVKCSD